MHLVAIQPQPPSHIMEILDRRDWLRLAQCLDDGFPANAAWASHGSLFERFVIASTVPTKAMPGTELHQQQMGALDAFLRAGLKEDVPFQDSMDLSLPLTIAALLGRADYLERLLAAGHSPNGLGPGTPSPLSILAARRQGGEDNPVYLPFALLRPCLTLLLKAGADPNQPAEEGWLPLQLAASASDLDMAVALLNAGANPNGKANGVAKQPGPRFTPLAWAILRNDWRMVELLLERGGRLMSRVEEMQISLAELAGKTASADVWRAIVATLGWEHEEVRRGWFQAVSNDCCLLVKWFLCAGYDPRPLNQWGWSALQLATKEKAWNVALLMAKCGLFDPHATDPEGLSPYARVKSARGKQGLLEMGWQTTLVAVGGTSGAQG